MGTWAPLIPYAKARLGIDEGVLGLLLLCLGMGSIITMPLSGTLVSRFGCRRVITVASLFIGAVLPVLATATSIPSLTLALFVFGASVGTVDVAINIQALIVEKASGRPMMSGFHGLYSAGGIVGAGVVSTLLSSQVSPLTAAVGVSAIIAVVLLLNGKHLLPYGTEGKSSLFVLPRGIVLVIGVLCFIVFQAEGAMLDWSAIFLTALNNGDSHQSGMGYMVFSATMTTGRLIGDFLVRLLGNKAILLYGGLCAALGLLLAVFVPYWIVALIGFGMVGAGCSNIVPVLFTLAGRQNVMPANLAITAITTLGYTGILLGPAVIGFVAHATSLSTAFIGVALLLLLVAASAPKIADVHSD